MIKRAEESRDGRKVMNMEDLIAQENSWKLSENFMRNCHEMGQAMLEE